MGSSAIGTMATMAASFAFLTFLAVPQAVLGEYTYPPFTGSHLTEEFRGKSHQFAHLPENFLETSHQPVLAFSWKVPREISLTSFFVQLKSSLRNMSLPGPLPSS